MKRFLFLLSLAALAVLAFVPEVRDLVLHLSGGMNMALMVGAVLAPSLERLYDKCKDVDADGEGTIRMDKTKLMDTLASAQSEIARATGGATNGGLRFVADGGVSVEEYMKRTERSMGDPTAFSHHLQGIQRSEPNRYEALKRATSEAVKAASGVGGGVDNATGESLRYAMQHLMGIKSPQIRTTTNGISTGTGLTPYALATPGKYLSPFLAPLYYAIKRTVVGGNQFNAKRILAIDQGGGFGFVAEATGNTAGRADYVPITTDNFNMLFACLGADEYLTTWAQYASKSTVDGGDFNLQELTALVGLQAYIMRWEWAQLYANGGANNTVATTALGVPATPLVTTQQAASTVGSLTASTSYDIYVSALSGLGIKTGAKGRVSSVDSEGESMPSTVLTVSTAASGDGSKSITIYLTGATIPRGCAGLNVYVCANGGTPLWVKTVYNSGWDGFTSGAKPTLSSTNAIIIDHLGTANHTVNTADTTLDANAFAGMNTLICRDPNVNTSFANGDATSGPYLSDLGAAKFTGDSTTGVNEFDLLMLAAWENFRISPTEFTMNARDAKAATRIILGSSAPVMRVELTDGMQGVKGTIIATEQLNPYIASGIPVKFQIHPYLTRGTVLSRCDRIQDFFPQAGVAQSFEVLLGFDALRLDFAQTGLKRETGTYGFGGMLNLFPGSTGAIINTGN